MKKLKDPELDISTARKIFGEGDKYWKSEVLKYFSETELIGLGKWVIIPDKKVGKSLLIGRIIDKDLVIGESNRPEKYTKETFDYWVKERSNFNWTFLDIKTILKHKTNLSEVYNMFKKGRHKLSKLIWSFDKTTNKPVIYNLETGEYINEPEEGFDKDTTASATYFSIIQKGQKTIFVNKRKKEKKLED